MRQLERWKWLIVPLGLCAIAAFILGIFFPWEGLFISLATTFFGIILTVAYVDNVFRRY